MKNRHPLTAALLLAASLGVLATSCGGAEPQAPASKATTASAQNAAAPTAPAASPTQEVAKSEGAADAAAPSQNPANFRQPPKRYEGGNEKLDSGYDLSSVKLPESKSSGVPTGAPEGAESAEGNQWKDLLPEAHAERNKGRFALDKEEKQTHDFGKMRQGEVNTHDFRLVSDGTEALIINSVKPSCGCTKAEVALLKDDGTKAPYTKGDPIAPGQKFVVETEINTDGRQGPFGTQVSLYGNDARGPFSVRLAAEVEPVLTVTPSQSVYFGRMTTADHAEQVVNVKSTRGEPFLLTLGQPAVQPEVQLSFAPKEPGADGKATEWDVHLALGPNAEPGMRNFPISLKTDIPIPHPKYPGKEGEVQCFSVGLNLQAQVTGMISTEPAFLTFGMVRPGEAVERVLRVECHDDFKLTSDIPVVFLGLQGQEFPYTKQFSVSVTPTEDGKAADVKVKLEGMPEDLNGSFGGVLRIQTKHPSMSDIEVRFSGVCRPGLPTSGGQGQQQRQ